MAIYTHTINNLDKLSKTLSRGFNWVGGLGLVFMLVLTVADVVAVKIFSHPIPGALELVSFLAVIVTAFAIAQTQVVKGHIQVDFFVDRLPQRWQGGVKAIVSLLALTLFGVLAWRSLLFGMDLQASGELSMTQRIPFYPFVYALSLCCIPMCLVLLVELINAVKKMVQP
jgi:TRAP-type C4-dicarboxylate transport system permease small subunit